MKKQNNANVEATQRGITLIALIITVIVLLILAGVTINLTLGENGIFKTAQLAAKNYTNAQEKELADLAEFNNTLNDTINGIGKGNIITTKPENKEGKIGISFTGVTTTETLPVTIKAKISNIENADVNLSNAKWVLNNSSDKIGTDSTLYIGSFTEENETEISINEAKEYYIHVLSTDNSGKTIETISKAVKVEGELHQHTGDATNGGGCYGEGQPIYHQHGDECYRVCGTKLHTHVFSTAVGSGLYSCDGCNWQGARYAGFTRLLSE